MNPSSSTQSIRIRPATIGDQPVIYGLAERIWNACYREMISDEQIRYMLPMMYGRDVVEREMGEGIVWEIMEDGAVPAGYLSYGGISAKTLKLHKIYLLPDYQGKGLGGRMLEHVEDYAKSHGYGGIVLNVNRNNFRGIRAYKGKGYIVAEEIAADIGGGFVMDDYIMEKRLEEGS
jgi:diamine N-acetyltransferase